MNEETKQTIALLGDIMMTRSVSVFREPEYLKMRDMLTAADAVFANFESCAHPYLDDQHHVIHDRAPPWASFMFGLSRIASVNLGMAARPTSRFCRARPAARTRSQRRWTPFFWIETAPLAGRDQSNARPKLAGGESGTNLGLGKMDKSSARATNVVTRVDRRPQGGRTPFPTLPSLSAIRAGERPPRVTPQRAARPAQARRSPGEEPAREPANRPAERAARLYATPSPGLRPRWWRSLAGRTPLLPQKPCRSLRGRTEGQRRPPSDRRARPIAVATHPLE